MIKLVSRNKNNNFLDSKVFNQYNFFENYEQSLNKAVIQNLKQEIESRDYYIMKSEWRKINGYIVKDIQQRTIITIYGAVTYYRRRYSYFDKEKNKQCYTFLVDREFQVERKQRISLHLKLKILEEISSGSRQVDILKLYRVSGISQMTISNVIRQFNFANLLNCKNKSYEKIKVDKYLYAWIDETFIKLRNNGRKSTKYRFRLVTFHTGKRLTNLTSTRNELINKRAFCLIVPEKEEINTETFAKQVYNMADMFYENIKQAKIIIGGDGAKWIEDISKSLDNSEYVLDLFHGTRQLYWNLKKKQNVLYSSIYNHAANLLRKGSYLELINFLKVSSTFMRTQEQKQKLKALVKYFKIKNKVLLIKEQVEMLVLMLKGKYRTLLNDY